MSRKRSILVIEHTASEGLGSFAVACEKLGIETEEFLAPAMTAAQWKKALKAKVVFIMGGPMGVYDADQYPFLTQEIKLLKARIAENAATLGICLGAQLLAAAAGGRVFHSGKREVGWFRVTPTPAGQADLLLGKLDWSNPVLHWHQDTYELPAQAKHLLESERFQQQAFSLSPQLYGLQFHPEILEHELPQWISSEPQLPYGRIDGVQSQAEITMGAKRHGQALEKLSCDLVSGFLAKAY